MQSNQLQNKKQIEIDRPAALLPGFYSIQALSEGGVLPHITQYHKKPEPAVQWKNVMAKKRLHDAYALCSSESRWDIYGRSGKLHGTRTTITPESGTYMEQHKPVVVDRDEYVESVRQILGESIACITFAEHHAMASSVGHSNMVAVARHMIMDASEEDARHIYLADSISSGCRVQGWFMDPRSVSMEFMNKYLDRHKWLSQGWPLANDHHLQVLAYRMATLRPMYLLELLMDVAELEWMGEHRSLASMRIQGTSPEKLAELAYRILEGMEAAVIIPGPQSLEIIDEEHLAKHAKRIASVYKTMFAVK